MDPTASAYDGASGGGGGGGGGGGAGAVSGSGGRGGVGRGGGASAEDVDVADSMVVVGGASMPRAPEGLLKCLAAGLFLNMAMRIPKGAYVPPKAKATAAGKGKVTAAELMDKVRYSDIQIFRY